MNSTSWIYPFIILGGVLQTCGAAMNAQLFHSLGNRWLASSVSFAVITAFFLCVFAMFPTPLPTAEGLANMPWWAVVGGLVGAVQVYAGLTLVNKVGSRNLRWIDRHRGFNDVADARPLRLVPHADACHQHRPHHRCSPYDRRSVFDLKELKGTQQ